MKMEFFFFCNDIWFYPLNEIFYCHWNNRKKTPYFLNSFLTEKKDKIHFMYFIQRHKVYFWQPCLHFIPVSTKRMSTGHSAPLKCLTETLKWKWCFLKKCETYKKKTLLISKSLQLCWRLSNDYFITKIVDVSLICPKKASPDVENPMLA